MLRSHEASSFPGGIIASLSIPWGFTKGDEDLGGYHLVWPRDLVETAGGLLAAGALPRTRAASSRYLADRPRRPTATGRQNMWLDGDALLERHPDGRDAPSRSCWSICCGARAR